MMLLILIEHLPKTRVFNIQYKSRNWFLYEITDFYVKFNTRLKWVNISSHENEKAILSS